MNPKKIFDFIGKKNPKYDLENIIKFYGTGMYLGSSERNYNYDVTEKLFKFIDDPSEELQLFSISINGGNFIRFIKNPSEQVQLSAVKNYPLSIGHIENPTELVQLRAIEKSPYAIQYINNPSEELQLKVIGVDAAFIQYINNPSEEVQLKVLDINPNLISQIKNPIDKVKNMYIEILNYELEYYEELLTRKPNVTFVKPRLENIINKLKELEIPHDNILYLKIQEIIKKMNNEPQNNI